MTDLVRAAFYAGFFAALDETEKLRPITDKTRREVADRAWGKSPFSFGDLPDPSSPSPSPLKRAA